MKTKKQKFFSITLILPHSHGLGRNVVEAWLQFFFNTNLGGRDLSEFIGDKTIHLISISGNHGFSKWWEKAYAVSNITIND